MDPQGFLHKSEDSLCTITQESLKDITTRRWDYCLDNPKDNTGTPCKTQTQCAKDFLPETYPWALYTQTQDRTMSEENESDCRRTRPTQARRKTA